MTDLPAPSDNSAPVDALPLDAEFTIGQWYWVKVSDDDDKLCEKLACITEIGSNYVKLTAPSRYGHNVWRVHYTNYHASLRRELNASAAIAERVGHYQKQITDAMNEVKAITARLGVNPQARLQAPAQAETQALAVVSSAVDPKKYEQALILAQKEQLPDLFKAIGEASEQLAKWMKAELLPLEAMTSELKGSMDVIQGRILNVSLYAGLAESMKLCRDGAQAAFHEKLHVMQRRLYMDEECFFGYQVGGIDITEIGMFDKFLCTPDIFERIFPFPRTMVAFRVRRKTKERDWDGSVSSLFVNMGLSDQDGRTFLYIRNGEQLHRLECALEFDELIFPSPDTMDLNEPMMMRKRHSGWSFMPVREWETIRAADMERQKLSDAWKAANPEAEFYANPHRHDDFLGDTWEPFTEDSVYFDDAKRQMADQMAKYNRIALVIQGLFDRSECLHPHPPVKTWTPDGFAAAVHLVYDGANLLYDGDPPDFEAYIAACNAQITADSVLWGQDLYWQKREAEKESKRLDNDFRNRSEWRPKLFKPYGNEGPGELARPAEWKSKAKAAVFVWERERMTLPRNRWDPDGPIRTTLTVPADELFNVSAYQPGDFKRFFADGRTRQQYLKWGPMLIAAEEFHAGNKRAQPRP